MQTVSNSVYDHYDHLHNQIDLLNMTIATSNDYLSFISVSIGLIATISMFILGYKITTGR